MVLAFSLEIQKYFCIFLDIDCICLNLVILLFFLCIACKIQSQLHFLGKQTNKKTLQKWELYHPELIPVELEELFKLY